MNFVQDGPPYVLLQIAKVFLKINWNAETSWPLSRDFEALKTVSKEFFKKSFSFSRYGPVKSSFLLIRKVSEKGRENMRSIPLLTGKGALTSNTIFGFFACQIYQRQRAVLCARWSLDFFKFDLNMASLNKDSSQKDILDDGINILAVSVEQMMCVPTCLS